MTSSGTGAGDNVSSRPRGPSPSYGTRPLSVQTTARPHRDARSRGPSLLHHQAAL